MTDKFEVQIPPRTRFTPQFRQLLHSNQHVMKRNRSEPFHRVGSFEEYGHDVVLVLNRQPDQYPSKLSIIGSGTKNSAWIREEIERVFEINGSGVRILRADLAADLPVNVRWLHRNSTVQFKHATQEFPVPVNQGGVQTLYFGKRPNQIVMYDKRVERLSALAKQLGLTARHADVEAMYSRMYGKSVEEPWTRVERRYGAKAIPANMRSFSKFWDNVETLEPFNTVRITPIAEVEPECFRCPLSLHLKVDGIWRRINQNGLHATRRWLDEKTNRNGSKVWRQIEPYLPKSSEIAVPNLNELFQQSLQRQLAA